MYCVESANAVEPTLSVNVVVLEFEYTWAAPLKAAAPEFIGVNITPGAKSNTGAENVNVAIVALVAQLVPVVNVMIPPVSPPTMVRIGPVPAPVPATAAGDVAEG